MIDHFSRYLLACHLTNSYSEAEETQALERYNGRPPHWALAPEEGGDPLVPAEAHRGDRAVRIPGRQGWAKVAKAKRDKMMKEAA